MMMMERNEGEKEGRMMTVTMMMNQTFLELKSMNFLNQKEGLKRDGSEKKMCKVSKHSPCSFPKEVTENVPHQNKEITQETEEMGYREYTNQMEINPQGQKSDSRIIHIPEEQSTPPQLENMNEVLQGEV